VSGEGDVQRIEWRPIKHSDYELGPSYTKEFSLIGKDNVAEKVRVMEKPGLFSKDFKVSKCSESGCKEEPLAAEEEQQATRCSFSGRLDSDPDSTVYISGCPSTENMDISLMSGKSKLQYNTYRVDNSGQITVDKNTTFSDVRKEGGDYSYYGEIESEDDGWEDIGTDYSDDGPNQGKASVMLHGYTYTYMHRKPRKGQKGPCCRPTKQKCRRDNNLRNVCKTKSGRTKCGEGCTRLIEALEGLQRKEQMKKKKKEEKLKKAKLMQNLGQKPGRQTEDSESFEEYSSESEEYSDEYQDTAKKEIPTQSRPYAKKRGDPNVFRRSETKQEGGSNMGLRVKKGQKLSQKQLNMLESASQVRKTSTNPLCKEKPNLFRSRQILHYSRCGKDICKKKQPTPQKKIYRDKTIEVGVYIDRHLYKNMEEMLKTEDEVKVKAQLLRMVHSLFLQVEAFLMNPTFSSKGGFRIIINGITIYQKYGPLESEWDSQLMATQMLRKFQAFANKVNSQCDGDRDGYDAMVLLTGRYDYTDMRPGGSIGYALTGQVCTIAPTVTLTLRLDKQGSHSLVMPRLLAHEFGHLLGSDHDGDVARGMHSIYKNQPRVPCPSGQSLMSPTVGMAMQTWSECTRKMIDAEFDRREAKKKNCFYT